MSESTTDRCTRVGAYSRRCMEVFTHVCVPLWSQCLTVSACLFLLRYTHTHARILRTEANLPTRVHNEAVSRSRGGFAGVGGEFTEALPRSLSRKPLLGRVWNIGSHGGPYFWNDRGSVELRKLQEKGDGSYLPDARILGTRVLCWLSYGLWETRIVSGWISWKNFGRTRLLIKRKIP